MPKIVICAMYKFVPLDNIIELKETILNEMLKNNVRGTLLLANEGINGTIAGLRKEVNNLIQYLKSDIRFEDIKYKESFSEMMPFYRSRVRLKKEIVTIGINCINQDKVSDKYVKPTEWNDLISDPDVLVIDTRNKYEIEIGTFKNAINPYIENFREFPGYVNNNLDPKKHKKIAMFCTGGIRCEKSTALLLDKGFEEVFHLQGGILKYFEKISENKTMWQGECFVFDSRVAIKHDLTKGDYDQCFSCRMPIKENDKFRHEYYKGISCHHCYGKISIKQKARFTERKKQSELAAKHGFSHIGEEAKKLAQLNKIRKRI